MLMFKSINTDELENLLVNKKVNLPYYKKEYNDWLDNLGQLRLIFDDDKIIGLCNYSKYKLPNAIRLSFLEIDPKYQNNGYGSKILSELQSKYEEIIVVSENADTNRFYKQNNFICIDREAPKIYWWRKVYEYY